MIDPTKLTQELLERGHEWADKDAAYFALDETKKDVLAFCISRVNDQDLSQVAKEQQARLMPEWKDNQTALVEAKLEMNKARVNYTVAQAFIELVRSREATNRAEIALQ